MKVYTISEVAEMLKVSRQTIWRWMRIGLLSYRQLGPGDRGSIRFTESDIKSFLKKAKKGSIPLLRS
ncbi:helix-turn-helix domain-containing protein [bacterium]|nr:helix-turn-helix domain-containing protein [bacterium]